MKTVMGLCAEERPQEGKQVEEVGRGKDREKDSQGQLQTDTEGEGANEG